MAKIVDSNIEALHTLVNVTGCVVETTPIVLGGETIGHTIWTANRTPVTIYKGKDDAMPMISLTQSGDKKWYWTLNGKLIKDVQGNPVCANGHAAGEYVPKPQLKAGVNMTVDTENTPIDKKLFICLLMMERAGLRYLVRIREMDMLLLQESSIKKVR